MIYRYSNEDTDFCIDLSDLSFVQVVKEVLLFICKSKQEPYQFRLKNKDIAWDAYDSVVCAWKDFNVWSKK